MNRPTLAFAVLLSVAGAASAQDFPEEPAVIVPAEPVPDAAPDANAKPSPALSPQQVIAAQLAALRHNDAADAGIKTAFRFASPQNRQMTGPIDQFILLVRNEQYAPLIGHAAAERSDLHVLGDAAEQMVKVTAADGTRAIYLFRVTRQPDGVFKDCWMTDAVIRVDAPPPPVPGEMI